MFIKLKSNNNKNFSWIINKNPETLKSEPFTKKLKQGIIIKGNNNEYQC